MPACESSSTYFGVKPAGMTVPALSLRLCRLRAGLRRAVGAMRLVPFCHGLPVHAPHQCRAPEKKFLRVRRPSRTAQATRRTCERICGNELRVPSPSDLPCLARLALDRARRRRLPRARLPWVPVARTRWLRRTSTPRRTRAPRRRSSTLRRSSTPRRRAPMPRVWCSRALVCLDRWPRRLLVWLLVRYVEKLTLDCGPRH